MGLAALMMTASLTVAQGYTPQRAEAYRNFLGGDILVYPAWTWPAEADLESLRPGDLTLSAFSASFGSPLRYFHPNYYTDGYLTAVEGGAPRYSMFESRAEFEATIAQIRAMPGVARVSAYTCLPVLGTNLGGTIRVSTTDWMVRACPPALLAGPDGEFPAVWADVLRPGGTGTEHGVSLKGGQWLSEDEDGLVAMIPDGVPGMGGARALGQKIRLVLPSLIPAGSGRPARFAGPEEVREVELTIVGIYELPTRVLSWRDKRGEPQQEQLYWRAPEVLVPPKTLDRLLRMLGLGPEDVPPVGALLVSLEDQSAVEAVAGELRRSLAGLSVVSVTQETDYANQRRLPEPILQYPRELLTAPPPLGQPVIPAQAEGFFGFILFGFAGLVAAGSGTLLVMRRRAEFAILKAIGLRNWEVGITVVVEVSTLAAVGCLCGFGLGAISALPSLLANGVDAGKSVALLARSLGLVVASTLGIGVVSSLAPLARTLRISVMEVMRTDE